MCKKMSIAITLCALAGGFSVAEAQVMCGDTITTPEVLTSDLNCGSHHPALTVQGPGGRLDMRGFTLSCEGSGADGIRLTGTGALVQNGTVTDCFQAVDLAGDQHRVLNMILRNSDQEGLTINSGSGHRIIGNIARNNGESGFQNFGNDSRFSLNGATNNGVAGFETGFGDTYTGNVAARNIASGFFIAADNNVLSQNSARGNNQNGFFVHSSGNTLTRSNARNNLDDGIDIDLGFLDNTLTENNASGNGSADDEGNGGFDLEDENPDCDNNTWTNNRGTRNQDCIQ